MKKTYKFKTFINFFRSSVEVVTMSSINREQASLFTIITSLKYKFVLCLLKDNERNRLVSVYNDIIKFFNT